MAFIHKHHYVLEFEYRNPINGLTTQVYKCRCGKGYEETKPTKITYTETYKR